MSEQTNTTANQATQETKTAPLPIKLDVRVRPIEPKDNLLAFASVVINDSFLVDGIKLCSGKNGPYLNMPGATSQKSNTWRDHCKPITAEFRDQLTTAVVVGYDQAIEKLQNTLENSTKAIAEKPSLRESLQANKDRVAAQPPRQAQAAPVAAQPSI